MVVATTVKLVGSFKVSDESASDCEIRMLLLVYPCFQASPLFASCLYSQYYILLLCIIVNTSGR